MSPGPRASESGVLLGLEGQRGSHHLLTPTPCTTSDRNPGCYQFDLTVDER